MFLGIDSSKPGLKSVLENRKILKIIHDCRSDWDSLLYQYSVRLYSFIDTQEAYSVYILFYNQEICFPISLLNFIKLFADTNLEIKKKMKQNMSENPNIWSIRPLSKEMLLYAAEDVKYLGLAWKNLEAKINSYLVEIIKVLSILKVVDKNIFEEFSNYLNTTFFENYKLYVDKKIAYDYLIRMDYVYGFFQMKNSENSRNENETDFLKFAFDYKKKKRVENLKDIAQRFNNNYFNHEIKNKKREVNFFQKVIEYEIFAIEGKTNLCKIYQKINDHPKQVGNKVAANYKNKNHSNYSEPSSIYEEIKQNHRKNTKDNFEENKTDSNQSPSPESNEKLNKLINNNSLIVAEKGEIEKNENSKSNTDYKYSYKSYKYNYYPYKFNKGNKKDFNINNQKYFFRNKKNVKGWNDKYKLYDSNFNRHKKDKFYNQSSKEDQSKKNNYYELKAFEITNENMSDLKFPIEGTKKQELEVLTNSFEELVSKC